ncbi:MAG: VCBS repeat-containing protein [Verrucomicrobia bacterium]|nr:VCBS repeat-containing protein [Verrucomicrobiota bacterium]
MNSDSDRHSVSQTFQSGDKPRLSPRRRKLRSTAAVLSLALGLGLIGGILAYFSTHPRQYRPDEKPPDITSSLTRGLPPEAPRPQFTDVTRAAGLASFRTFAGDRTSQLPEDMGPGAAWGDFDNDGDDDLFLVSAGGPLHVPSGQLLPCELHENLGTGAFRKVEGFPSVRLYGMGAAWGDYDGDGFLDLAVSGYNALLLFHNEGGAGRFVPEARFASRKGFWSGVSWGDYDNDRDLDLYVCGYVQYAENEVDRTRGSEQLGTFVPYTLNPASYQPALNLLFRNDGDGTLTEVAQQLGVTNPTGRSLGALWHDLDDDGWLDLYVANDISDNVFYRNVGGRFQDISHAAWVADYRSAMGLAAGDYNRDGDDDLFITHWVAQENALYDNVWADFNAPTAETNLPPVNFLGVSEKVGERVGGTPAINAQPSHSLTDPFTYSPKQQEQARTPSESAKKKYSLRFMDIADRKGLGQIALPFVGWGTEFVDFDGDGWLDLIVANGNTLEFNSPAPKRLKPQEPFLFWNHRGESFHDLAPLSKSLAEQHVSRGLAVSDFDNDGDMDILLAHLGEGAQLLRNDMQTGHWLKVRLRSRLKNGAALGFGDGAKVIAHIEGAALRRTVSSASYLSQSSRTLHFGLGAAKVVERLEIRWLGGQTNFFSNLDADTTWEITESDTAPKRIDARSSQGGSSTGNPTPSAQENLEGSPPSPLAHRLSPSVDPQAPITNLQSHTSAMRTPAVNADKARIVEFWNRQRAAMNALKLEKNVPKAIQLFRQALELDPRHEDALYYLGQCLASEGDVASALAQWDELIRLNPQSHRAHQQWGTLRALTSASAANLQSAQARLERAHAINPEETGALLVLGEIALLRGEKDKAEQRLAAACRTNPRAVGGFFLRAYLAWKRGDESRARELLTEARQALGKDWQPKGSTSEGDVTKKHHTEGTPLSRFWESWDGGANPPGAFAPLEAHLRRKNGL